MIILISEKLITAYRLKYENKIGLSSVNYIDFWAEFSYFQRKSKNI